MIPIVIACFPLKAFLAIFLLAVAVIVRLLFIAFYLYKSFFIERVLGLFEKIGFAKKQ